MGPQLTLSRSAAWFGTSQEVLDPLSDLSLFSSTVASITVQAGSWWGFQRRGNGKPSLGMRYLMLPSHPVPYKC